MNQEKSPRLQTTSVVLVVLYTLITGGIYFPVWYLIRVREFNSLHSEVKVSRGIALFGVVCFCLTTLLSLYSGFTEGISLGISGESMAPTFNILDLVANIIALVVIIPMVQQTFKIKRILDDHFNAYLQRNIKFSTILTLLFLNIYLQFKINQLSR